MIDITDSQDRYEFYIEGDYNDGDYINNSSSFCLNTDDYYNWKSALLPEGFYIALAKIIKGFEDCDFDPSEEKLTPEITEKYSNIKDYMEAYKDNNYDLSCDDPEYEYYIEDDDEDRDSYENPNFITDIEEEINELLPNIEGDLIHSVSDIVLYKVLDKVIYVYDFDSNEFVKKATII